MPADDSLVRFRRVVAVALDELERRRSEVNDLNVFPVADGDTGDNMAMTMRAVLDELDRINGQPLDQIDRDDLVAAVARAALLGARGNSGVILSQIVRGAAEELASRPGEQDALLADVLERALDAGVEAVERGPEQLDVLRDAGVVDAGAYGLTVIVAGCLAALRGNDRPELDHQKVPAGPLHLPEH